MPYAVITVTEHHMSGANSQVFQITTLSDTLAYPRGAFRIGGDIGRARRVVIHPRAGRADGVEYGATATHDAPAVAHRHAGVLMSCKTHKPAPVDIQGRIHALRQHRSELHTDRPHKVPAAVHVWNPAPARPGKVQCGHAVPEKRAECTARRYIAKLPYIIQLTCVSG